MGKILSWPEANEPWLLSGPTAANEAAFKGIAPGNISLVPQG